MQSTTSLSQGRLLLHWRNRGEKERLYTLIKLHHLNICAGWLCAAIAQVDNTSSREWRQGTSNVPSIYTYRQTSHLYKLQEQSILACFSMAHDVALAVLRTVQQQHGPLWHSPRPPEHHGAPGHLNHQKANFKLFIIFTDLKAISAYLQTV